MTNQRTMQRWGWVPACGLLAAALWTGNAIAAETPLTAAEQMQKAHDGRAVWKTFPGFEAQIVARQNREEVRGKLSVAADGSLTFQLQNGSSAPDWLTRSLDSLIGHRLSDGEAIVDVEYADDDAQHPFGRLIRSKDSQDHSLWRVQGDVLTEVHRFNDKTHFVISVADVARTPEGAHLPQDFTVDTWDRATKRLIKSRQVHTTWKRIDGVDLPQSWWAVVNSDGEQRSVEAIELSQHRLLTPQTTAVPSTEKSTLSAR